MQASHQQHELVQPNQQISVETPKSIAFERLLGSTEKILLLQWQEELGYIFLMP
jgi:hypothetical protein